MKTCEEYAELISCLVDGELNDAEVEELQSHIERCENCRALFLAFSSVSDFLENELEEPPAELTENIMSDIRRTKLAAVKTGRQMRRKIIAAIASVAALAVICYTIPMLPFGINAGVAMKSAENYSAAVMYEDSGYAAAQAENTENRAMPAAETESVPAPAAEVPEAAFAAAGMAPDSGAADIMPLEENGIALFSVAEPEYDGFNASYVSGDDARALEELISHAQPEEDALIPDGCIGTYSIVIEESGSEYTLFCTEDSTFVMDSEGCLAVIPDCGNSVITGFVGNN